jgi:hypothetical protein
MADKITVRVDLHGLEEELLAIGPRIAKRLLRRALRSVGRAWVDIVKSFAPTGDVVKAKQGPEYTPGGLKACIDFKVVTNSSETAGTVTVGPTNVKGGPKRSPGVYALFVEFGLKAKEFAMHPFMRPAFDGSAERIIQLFADGLREDLEEAVKK